MQEGAVLFTKPCVQLSLHTAGAHTPSVMLAELLGIVDGCECYSASRSTGLQALACKYWPASMHHNSGLFLQGHQT